MLKQIKKILFFFSLLLIYFVFKELVILYQMLAGINTWLAYSFIVVVVFVIIYFVIVPILRILAVKVISPPAKIAEDEEEVISIRLEKFKANKFLLAKGFIIDPNKTNAENYKNAIKLLEEENEKLRKKYLSQLFYSTSISQNGFLDAIIILSTAVNLIKETFVLYNGRTNNRDLVIIAKKIYFAILISGTEGIENATEEIFAKFANESFKSIPFFDKIISSLMDGFISAALVTRISLIAENYCKKTLVTSDKELLPSYNEVLKSTKNVTFGILEEASDKLFEISKEKGNEIFKKAINPVSVLWDNSKDYINPVKTLGILSKPVEKMKKKLFNRS